MVVGGKSGVGVGVGMGVAGVVLDFAVCHVYGCGRLMVMLVNDVGIGLTGGAVHAGAAATRVGIGPASGVANVVVARVVPRRVGIGPTLVVNAGAKATQGGVINPNTDVALGIGPAVGEAM